MGKGKKKGGNQGQGDNKVKQETTSLVGLSLEDTPTTSVAAPEQPKPAAEEETEGLGLGVSKKRNKPRKKQQSAAQPVAESAASGSGVQQEPQVKQSLPQQSSQDVRQLAGPARGFPQQAGPTPGYPQPAGRGRPQQTGPSPGYPSQQDPTPGYPQPAGRGRPQQPGPPPGYPSQQDPTPGYPQQAGRGYARQPGPPGYPSQQGPAPVFPQHADPRGSGQPSFAQGAGRGKAQSASQRPTQSAPATSQPSFPDPTPTPAQIRPVSQAQASPSRQVSAKQAMCRYRIPDKIVGRTVRSTPIQVLTNYLPMTIKPIKVYRYDVSFKPDRPKKMLQTVFKLVVKSHYPKDFIAFDQSKNCYSFAPLKNVPADGRYSVNVDIKDANDRNMTFEVSFKPTGVVDLGNILKHMQTGGSSLNTPSEEIQCIDVILRQGALESYVKCGRQFFKRPNQPINLTGGMEIWTGLFQSAIFTTRGFINIDVAHKGFPIQQSVISALENSFNLSTNSTVEEQRSFNVELFKSFMQNLRVVARMVGPPNDGQTREFICNGLVGSPDKLFFTSKVGDKEVKMSVYEYFTKEKRYRIKYPRLNCAWVGPRDKKIYYPLELLEVAYGQAINKQLNEKQLSNMVRQAATPPDDRKRKIEEVARDMKYSENAFFKKFGLEISNQFFEVTAKVLQAPTLAVGGDGRPEIPRRGAWQARTLLKPEALLSWGFVAIDCDSQKSNYEGICDLLKNTGRQLGMRIEAPKMVKFRVRMTELRNLLLQAVDDGVKFLFIIVSSYGRDIYHKVKQIAECDVGILTQCIKEETASRKMNMQTMKNILLKVNSKLMGVNQSLDSKSMPRCLTAPGGVMIVGADVTHPSPDQSNIPSIAAVTASMDPKCFIYNIELSIQTPKKEMIVQFEDMIFDHLIVFRKRNNFLPRKIYIFRDGVSEGQFAEVMNSELAAVHNAYARLVQNAKPEVLFLLVQKRHHTRFFLGSRNTANVEPGTVVDTHIVHPKELDFYMVSHQAIKGTARPTRYHAVCNDSQLPEDEVEQLTYYLCHLYARCMRSVSYPTPTYYAHLACLRARSLTHGKQFDNRQLEKQPERLRVLDKMLEYSRMFFV